MGWISPDGSSLTSSGNDAVVDRLLGVLVCECARRGATMVEFRPGPKEVAIVPRAQGRELTFDSMPPRVWMLVLGWLVRQTRTVPWSASVAVASLCQMRRPRRVLVTIRSTGDVVLDWSAEAN